MNTIKTTKENLEAADLKLDTAIKAESAAREAAILKEISDRQAAINTESTERKKSNLFCS